MDCTHPSSESLCIKHRVDAFPTILVFRKDDTGKSQHESYHGERSVPAITGWADNFVKQARREIPKTTTPYPVRMNASNSRLVLRTACEG